MRFPILLTTAVCLALAGCQTVPAPTAAPTQATQQNAQTALQARVDSFNAAFLAGNYNVVTEVVPPRLVTLLAKRTAMSPTALKRLMLTSTQEVMSRATVHSSVMSVPDNAIKTAGGMNYALLPTKTDITVMGTRAKQSTTTVALQDNGKWYLVRVETASHEADLKTAYPELKSVKMR